ncbi:MAG: hypothetical protein R2851_04640 [Caldilineaceae bacterium]
MDLLRPSAQAVAAQRAASARCGRSAHQGRIYICPVCGAAAQAQVQPLRELFTAGTPPPADPATETPADFLWATLLAEAVDRSRPRLGRLD